MLIHNKFKMIKSYLSHPSASFIDNFITDEELHNQLNEISLEEQQVHQQQKKLSQGGKKSIDLLDLLSKLAKREITSSREESE